MIYYVVRHMAHEAYPTIQSGELRWYGRPRDFKHSQDAAERWRQYILDTAEDPMFDDDLIVVSIDV